MTLDISYSAVELVLHIENIEELYQYELQLFQKLAKKKDKGIFDRQLAEKAFTPLLKKAAIDYLREKGSPNVKYYNIFSSDERYQAATELVDHFEAWYSDQVMRSEFTEEV
jgi:hypothetical protein